MFKPETAELHMGILQNRLLKIKGQMNVAAAKMDMKDVKGIDPESERIRFLKLDKEYEQVDKELMEYENKVLDLTKL